MSVVSQSLVTLDVEGVLIPEIWIAVAEACGIEALKRTTRDEPDYDVLMKGRLQLLADHGVGMEQIQRVITGLRPLDGAKEFLDELRQNTQVILLSDTFRQFGAPMMAHLGFPTLLCHELVVENDSITGYRLRLADQKRCAVQSFQELNYTVAAAGDSYNDTTMLAQADRGYLFNAPQNVIDEFPQFPALDSYDGLLAALLEW